MIIAECTLVSISSLYQKHQTRVRQCHCKAIVKWDAC
jgi:hypothetical protein